MGSKPECEYSLTFVSFVGEVSTLLTRDFPLKRSVETLALSRSNRIGETFCGVGSRHGDEEVPPVVSVAGEFARRPLSLLTIADALFPMFSAIVYGNVVRATAEEGVLFDGEKSCGLGSQSP